MSKEKPIARSFGQNIRSKLGFAFLKGIPGVTVLSESQKMEPPNNWVQYKKGMWFRTASVAKYEPYDKTDPESTAYASMNKFYREYRRDMLVRVCLNTLAAFSCRLGFETVLETPEEMEEDEEAEYLKSYQDLKAYIDDVNEKIELDKMLYITVIKSKIFGHAGFEVIPWAKAKTSIRKTPERLLPLKSEDLSPDVNENWELTGFTYKNKEENYTPEQILYFTNNQLEADFEGLSDIEPIMDSLESRRTILSQSIKEGSTVLWAGIAVIQVDTSGMSDSDALQLLNDIENSIAPGKYMIVNQRVTVTIVDIKPNLKQFIDILDYLDAEIIGNFEIPRFLVGREKQFNRATAYAQLQAFIDGPVTRIRRWLKREVEHQWFDVLTLNYLSKRKPIEKDEMGNYKFPVHVRLQWDPISTEDISELFEALAKAYDGGMGFLPQEKCLELAGFDPEEVLNPVPIGEPPEEEPEEELEEIENGKNK